LRVEGGTRGTLNTSATTAGGLGMSSYFFSLNRQATDGGDITPDYLRARSGEAKEKDGYENITASGSLTSKLSDFVSSQLNVQYTDAQLDLDEGGSISTATPPFFQNVFEGLGNHGPDKELFL
jgi:outer membrane cobalamin receptor